MPKWSKNAKEFTVAISESHGININLPRPIWILLQKPNTITFKIKNDQIIIISNNTKLNNGISKHNMENVKN